jgi:hypothetical protein
MTRSVNETSPHPVLGRFTQTFDNTFTLLVEDPTILTKDEVSRIDDALQNVLEDTFCWTQQGIAMGLKVAVRRVVKGEPRRAMDKVLQWAIQRACPRWWYGTCAVVQYASQSERYAAPSDAELDRYIKEE